MKPKLFAMHEYIGKHIWKPLLCHGASSYVILKHCSCGAITYRYINNKLANYFWGNKNEKYFKTNGYVLAYSMQYTLKIIREYSKHMGYTIKKDKIDILLVEQDILIGRFHDTGTN